MNDSKKLKKNSYPASMNSSQRSKRDRRKVKHNVSPDVSKKKYSYYDPVKRRYYFADKESVLKNMIEKLN
jgi:hypothetical protein